MAEYVDLELREALSIVAALDAWINVVNARMAALVVVDQRRDVVEDRSALDAAVGESERFAESLEEQRLT